MSSELSMIEELQERFTQLQTSFEVDVEIKDAMLDHVSISIPKKMSKYIFFYHDCLNYLATIKDEKDSLYYHIMYEYRMGESALSKINWTATELKQVIESTSNMRDLNKQSALTESMLKTTEKMMSELKNVSFAISNNLTYKKIMNGIV